MVDKDLYIVLKALFDAGAQDVSAEQLPWEPRSTGVLVHALNMLYIKRYHTAGVTYFSLTDSGYRAIGKLPPRPPSVSGFLRWLFRRRKRRGGRGEGK